MRRYPKTADKILDAPNLIDDFCKAPRMSYTLLSLTHSPTHTHPLSLFLSPTDLNVMDWSQRGCLAIALGGAVYLLDTETSDSSSLCSTGSENTYVSSLRWNKTGQYLAVGTSNGDVQVECKLLQCA